MLAAAVALLAAAFLLASTAPPSADAVTPPNRCGKIHVKGKKYKVRGHVIKCRKARKHSKRFLKGRGHPRGFRCVRYPPRQTKIAFTCRKGKKDYYAIRK